MRLKMIRLNALEILENQFFWNIFSYKKNQSIFLLLLKKNTSY